MTVDLGALPPTAFDAWTVVFALAEDMPDDWAVVGGQMVQLHAAELGVSEGIRPTDDVDVIVDVRTWRTGTEQLATWLIEQGFTHAGASPDDIGHRYTRQSNPGPGTTIFDILAPEGLGTRAKLTTTPPARTLEVPGGTQALARAEFTNVVVRDLTGTMKAEGRARRPNLLGALVAKAAATTIAVRFNPDRDWQDAALLLANTRDPFELATHVDKKDRRRLRGLRPLYDRTHQGWALLRDDDHLRGSTALKILTTPPQPGHDKESS